jgi:hypothetical protein
LKEHITMTNEPTIGRALLLEILGWSRPHDSACETRFCHEYLDSVPGMKADDFGNRYLRIGDAPVMWSCHVDTVARHGGPQAIQLDLSTGIISLKDGKKKCSLGADDGVGVWIMLEMIRHKRPGLYVFHRGEERGCLGSAWIARHNPKFLEGIKAAVAFDRAGFDDVITHQMSGRTCSDAFAQSFAAQLNEGCKAFTYRPDDGGVYTDTNEYADVIAECSNISVGYHGQHSHKETQDLYHAEALLASVLQLDTAKLVMEREPGDFGDAYGAWERWAASGQGAGATKDWREGTGRTTRNAAYHSRNYTESAGPYTWDNIETPLDELAEIIMEHPYIAAAVLMGKNVSPNDLWSAVLEHDDLGLDDSRWDATEDDDYSHNTGKVAA